MSKSHPNLPPLDPLQRYSVDECMAYLRTARSSVYALINSGELGTITEGRRRYIPGSEIARRSTLPKATA